VVLVPLAEVFEEPDLRVPDAEPEPEAEPPDVAAALPSVDDPADPESVDLGASVIVPLAEPDSVAEGADDFVDSGGEVWDGASENQEN
jgi:hypothetical protein